MPPPKLNKSIIPPQPVNTIVIFVDVGSSFTYYIRQGDFWSAVDYFLNENKGPAAAAAACLQCSLTAIRCTFVFIDFHHGHQASSHNIFQMNVL